MQDMGDRHGRAPAKENSHHAAGEAENDGFPIMLTRSTLATLFRKTAATSGFNLVA